MADDQVRPLVLLLQCWLELPDFYVPYALQASCPRLTLLDEPAVVKVGVPALNDERGVPLSAEGIDDGLREGLLDESVEASRANGHEGTHGQRYEIDDDGTGESDVC